MFNVFLFTCLCFLTSGTLSALVDLNNNGLSDIWERNHNSGSLLPPTFVPGDDADGDGVSNKDEASAGTDPFDGKPPDGFFKATIIYIPAVHINGTGGDPEILTPEAFFNSWHALAGKHYTLLFSPGLETGSWTPVEETLAGYDHEIQIVTTLTQTGGGLPDKLFWRVAVKDVDTDGDGFNDWEETKRGTDPQVADRDDDGLPDAWEIENDLDPDDDGTSNPTQGSEGDPDGDGLVNRDEFSFQGNPQLQDTDSDHLDDLSEAWIYFTYLDQTDSDSDLLLDGDEVNIHHTEPRVWDTDEDTLFDGEEFLVYETNPLSNDSDSDSLKDAWEVAHELNPLQELGMHGANGDPDNDGLRNFIEQLLKLDPRSEDSDQDEIDDSDEDFDKDALSNGDESNHATNPTSPRKWDSDSDGMPDGWELINNLNPNSSSGISGGNGDPDDDDLDNFEEWLNDCDPRDADSDNDGTNDGVEVTQGSDPNDAGDGGIPPPSDQMIEVPFRVSDPSGSHSEKWKMNIRGLGPDDERMFSLASPDFGEPAIKSFKLRKSNRYEVSMEHLSTEPEYLELNDDNPDYDWEAFVEDKPTTTSVEEFADTPGVNKFFMIKDHWIVDNRQSVFTTEKHGDDNDIVTGHTAMLIPLPIERDKDVPDETWETIAGDLAKALPGQKMNLKINQSRLPSSIVLSDFHWKLPIPMFKNFTANQSTATLEKMEDDDTSQSEVHFYFTNAGTKDIKLEFKANGEALETNVALNILAPEVRFSRVKGRVEKQWHILTNKLYIRLVDATPGITVPYGMEWLGDVYVPAGWPQGKWNWVQTATPNISATTDNDVYQVYSTNGQTGMDTRYPISPIPPGSHPGDAEGFPTGNPSNGINTFGDSPGFRVEGYKRVSFDLNLTTYLMFLPDGEESRYVPTKSLDWWVKFTGEKDLISGQWGIFPTDNDPNDGVDPCSGDSGVVETSTHPTWQINMNGDLVSP